MIIRNERRRFRFGSRTIVIAIAAAVLLAVTALVVFDGKAEGPAEVFFDMETIVPDGEKVRFTSGELRAAHGETQNEEAARSGKYSSMVSNLQEFGVSYETRDIRPGELYEISIWRKSEGEDGRLVADGSWGLYKSGVISGRTDGAWEEVTLTVKIPEHVEKGLLKIYVWNPKESLVWFDDMRIRRVTRSHKRLAKTFSAEDSIPILNVIISEQGMDKLEAIRLRALQKGLLQVGDDDWVKAKLEEGKKQYKAKLRLKGDWTDHLRGDKWSYRISMGPGQAWNRLITFSVQNPNTRHHLSEWVYHKWLHAEDVLTPRYDFINLKVNGVSKGIFAYEEHFEKQLPEYNMRREGPILKYVEEGFWDVMEVSMNNENTWIENRVPIFRSSNISAFKLNRTLKDSTLRGQLEIAQSLMSQYKHGQLGIHDIFDVRRMARYYAIVDICRAHHGFIWHNQRMYYNPVISRLEPIGFDGYTYDGPFVWIKRPFLGYARNFRYMKPGYREQMFERFFHDEEFLRTYISYLYQYSSEDYIRSFFDKIGPELNQRERWLRKEWPNYHYDRKFLYDQAAKIRLTMMPMKRTSVKAHLQGKRGDHYAYKVFNYHCLPVKVLGVGKKEDKMDAAFEEQQLLDAYADEFPAEFLDMKAPASGKWIFFEIPGLDSTFSAEILQWEAPEAMTPEQELFADAQPVSNDIYKVDEAEKRITFPSGKYQSDKDILIPRGWQVRFEAGVELDLIRKAKFISKSQVLMFGTEERPITVTSSDKSANGFTVLQAEGKSEVHYVIFDNLNTMSHKGWNLTGAVSFYESEVLIRNSRFVNNHCEDALNLVRCVFHMHDSYVGHTFGDGFDADFCTGTVQNCFFFRTGNDGMDFSGSNITISMTEVDQAGDKGISLGEESDISIESATVTNSVIGVAAKDLTEVDIKWVKLVGNQQAFALYQKKPEYGPATIKVKDYIAEDNGQLHLVQAGSELKLGERVIKGKK